MIKMENKESIGIGLDIVTKADFECYDSIQKRDNTVPIEKIVALSLGVLNKKQVI